MSSFFIIYIKRYSLGDDDLSSNRKKREKLNCEEYNIYYGIPHCHTSASTGRGTIQEAVEHCKQKSLDYIIFTDHYSYLNKLAKHGKSLWATQKDIIKKYAHEYKHFLTCNGFEYKLFQNLDINILHEKQCIDGKLTINEFYNWLRKYKAIGIINHPGESIRKIENYLELNKYITCIETGNGSYPNRYKRYYKKYFYMLDMGWKLAAVNGQDNHRKNWGDSDNVTAVLMRNLNRDSLHDAFKDRHTYSTESKTLKINFKLNDQIMGDEIKVKKTDKLEFSIYVEDPLHEIQNILVYTNKGVIIKENTMKDNKAHMSFQMDCPSLNSWYVVNVLLENDKEAITSPIFIQVQH